VVKYWYRSLLMEKRWIVKMQLWVVGRIPEMRWVHKKPFWWIIQIWSRVPLVR
jgi:hypothetical protein